MTGGPSGKYKKFTTQLFGGCAAGLGTFLAVMAIATYNGNINMPKIVDMLDLLAIPLGFGVVYAGIKIFQSGERM